MDGIDVQSLIVQGGALAVILSTFVLIVRWMLNQFTKSLERLERSLHANTLSLILLTKQSFLHTVGDKVFDSADEVKRIIDEYTSNLDAIVSILEGLNGKT